MKYQLVLQFPETLMEHEKLVMLEDLLIDKLEKIATVDGHDIGSGEINIFIFTNEPKQCFDIVKNIIDNDKIDNLKAAYRDIEKESFIIFWPENLKEFIVI